MKIALIGTGKMGEQVAKRANVVARYNSKTTLSNLPTDVDVVIEFSTAQCVLENVSRVAAAGKPHIIGTTGWEGSLPKAREIVESAGSAALFAPNFSLGIALFMRLLAQASDLMKPFPEYSVGGIEIHHSGKKDAPSGTARAIEQVFDGKLHFSSLRLGHVPGTHSVLFDSPSDTITLTHEARNREGFASGALIAAQWILGKKGMVYTR